MFFDQIAIFFRHIADVPYYIQLFAVALSAVLLLGGGIWGRKGALLFLSDLFGVFARYVVCSSSATTSLRIAQIRLKMSKVQAGILCPHKMFSAPVVHG